MKFLLTIAFLSSLLSMPLNAEVLCIRKKVKVIDGRISLARGIRKISGKVCPVGTKLITDLSGLANEGGEIPDVAPGKLISGTYSLAGYSNGSEAYATSNISFPAEVGGTLPAHIIGSGGSPTSECPGSATAPDAAPGHFCVYVNSATNISVHVVWDPYTLFPDTASPKGASLFAYSLGLGNFWSWGTWAVRPIQIS
jgi:hypothetical protein